MNWFSSLLLYSLESPSDREFHRSVESLIVFRARDFDDARERALAIGRQHAERGKVFADDGTMAIKMQLCRIMNLDHVGSKIDGAEVWSKLSETERPLEIDLAAYQRMLSKVGRRRQF